MDGGIVLLLWIGSMAIMIVGTIFELIPLILIGLVGFVVILVIILKSVNRLKKKLAEDQRNQIKALQSIVRIFRMIIFESIWSLKIVVRRTLQLLVLKIISGGITLRFQQNWFTPVPLLVVSRQKVCIFQEDILRSQMA